MKKFTLLAVCATVLLFFGSLGSGWAQTTVFSDDFSTNQSTSWTTSGQIGSSAFSVTRSGDDFGARRNTSPGQLELTNDVGATTNVNGWAFAYTATGSFSSPYNTTLSSNSGVVTWYFNMRQIRTDPAGFASGSYGVAFVLGGTSTTAFNAGNGYAVVLGQSGSTDPIRLAKYTTGLSGTLTNILTSNTSGLTDFGAEYLSIKVTYTPSTNTWELFVRNDGATAFNDPTTGTLTSQGTAIDNTYTGTSLSYLGGYWSGSTTATQTAFFDNITVQVTPAGVSAPTTQASNINFSSVGQNGMTASWTNGDGAKRVVIMNTSNSFTAPTDGTDPTANTVYGGSGEQVVYNGSGNSAAVTGLTASTTYWFRVYEYNGSGTGTKYLTTTATNNPNSQVTVPGNPVAIAATDVLSDGFKANWNASTGATSYRLDVYTKTSGSNASDLFISEYIEGSGSEKYIEIFNGTGASVDLSDYKLRLFSNGSATPNEDVALSGTLNNGATIVYRNSASTLYPSGISNAAVNFNGDDAVALYKISTSAYVDIFGRIGEDPGTEWGTSPLWTINTTLVRKSNVTGGVTTNPSSGFPTLATEWDNYATDVITYLGSHTFSGGVTITPVYTDVNVGNVTSYSVTNLNPSTTYYYVVRALNGGGTSANSNEITVTTSYGAKVTTQAGDWNTIVWSPAGTPTSTDNVTINHAVTLAGTADCNDLTIDAGSLTLAPGASLINRGTVTGTATVNFGFSANEWHLISPPISDATANTFYDRFLMYHTEGDDSYTYIEPEVTSLNVMQGYALWGETGYTGSAFVGTLNAGPQSRGVVKTFNGWNLVGNPYPSSIDWDETTGWTKTNVANATYVHVNSTTWASYIDGVGNNGGSQYIAPCQGFFVEATGSGTLGMDNNVRVHNATPFYKSTQAVGNLVRLEVSGNGYRDEAVVYIKTGSTNTFDGWADARKLYGTVDAAAQIYSLGDTPLSINAIPEAQPVTVGIKVGTSGSYTIAATEINGLTNVKLEDTKTGIITSLAEKSYTFNWEAGENENRFILRFAAVGTPDPEKEISSIYSYDKTAIVDLPANVRGQVYVYNLAGQPVAVRESATGQVRIALSPTGVYVVKVVTARETLTKKVWIR